ncbi:hypothetical protein [Bacillus benzoevorans]|uniref:Uncharacterized protein n=1 Tax=Bacillus benzoevorans TaxID=1456 RepID=A0A7X0HTP6_9BACI|nr:hypothetical protein [Bacillus benzoevorans]MBB6446689.1 hypothetical protein [Bacillus benzoevorans]
MNNWADALFKLFGRRKKSRGFLWASLIGLGVSAAAYGFKRKGNRRTDTSLENVLDTFRMQNSRFTPAAAGTAEIANEYVPVVQDLLEKK